ncbi:hypothetical protein D9M70_231020 [compost metagenome]
MHAQAIIDYCIRTMPHLACAHWVEDRGAVATNECEHVLLALHRGARVVLVGDITGHGRGRRQLARQLEATDHGLAILFSGEIVRLNQRCILGILRANAQFTTAGWAQLAHRHGETRPFVWLPGRHVGAERAKVELHIRCCFFRPRPGEHAALLDAHRQRSFPEECPLHTDQRLPPERTQLVIGGNGLGALEHDANLEMILQVATDARKLMDYVDSVLLQHLARTDAGELQQLRRLQSACT